MKWLFSLCLHGLLLASASGRTAELSPGSWDVHWDGGAQTCSSVPLKDPIQTHRYNERTFILREKLCATWEAPFMYLLVGSRQALLIDTGDIADSAAVPLEPTIMALLPGETGAKMPLIVVHSHGHLDHRAADTQFDHQGGVTLVLLFAAGLYFRRVENSSDRMWFSNAVMASVIGFTIGTLGSSSATFFFIARCQSRVFRLCRYRFPFSSPSHQIGQEQFM